MPMRLEIKRKLLSRSDRVKAVDLHPTEPWICAAIYTGSVHVWNMEAQQLIKTIEVCNFPVRAVKFVARKNWIITGSDDMSVRVFNYNTLELVHQFEAHSDYIRSIVVHPTQPFILTSSDDTTIRLWDWDRNWKEIQVFEGHNHYVMQICINPKDNNTFASASLDHTIKVWSLGSPNPNFTLEGHEHGVNCVDYYIYGDKPYLASGSDDKTVKIWDYQTKACVQTLEGHTQNISSVVFHPELPIILTGSEDGTVRVWNSVTYHLENTLNYSLERVWSMTCQKGKQFVAIAYDEGTIVVSLGRDEPAVSMDNSGKIVCARHNELIQTNLRVLNFGENGEAIPDGEYLPVAFKEGCMSEIYPQSIAHSANGRFVSVYGDGEYVIYTSLMLRNTTFGQALEFVWSSDSNMYAIRENNRSIKVFKKMKEFRSFDLDMGAEQLFGGLLLGVRFINCLTFYDWESGLMIRRIEIVPNLVYWNDSSQLVALCTSDSIFILRYAADVVEKSQTTVKNGNNNNSEGIENAFQLIPNGQINVQVRNGCWYGEVFMFTTKTNRLCYYVGGELMNIALLDRPLYLLGYLSKVNRVFLTDRDLKIVSYRLSVSVLEYETAIMRNDMDTASSILANVPQDQYCKLAQFLEKQGFVKLAMQITTDSEHKFELALQLNDYDLCHQIATSGDPEVNHSKLKQLAEAACRACKLPLALDCLKRIKDYASLFILATSLGDSDLLKWIGQNAAEQNQGNIVFLTRFLLADLEGCLELLTASKRLPEAAFFARSYLPSQIDRVVEDWRTYLAGNDSKASQKIAQCLANPKQYPNLFPGIDKALQAEQYMKSDRLVRGKLAASDYPKQPRLEDRDPQTEMASNNNDNNENPFLIDQQLKNLNLNSEPALTNSVQSLNDDYCEEEEEEEEEEEADVNQSDEEDEDEDEDDEE